MSTRLLLALSCVVALSAFGASAAQAAAQLELTAGGPPGALGPGATATGVMTFTNTGDASVLSGAATVTVALPSELAALETNSPNWAGCSIDEIANEVTCTGPAATYQILAGASQCAQFGLEFLSAPCPIELTVKAGDDAPKGSYETTIEACVAGVTPCTTTTATTAIREFGDRFGIAEVNVPGAQQAPAFPGQHAFWAGACDLAGAPAPAEPPTAIDGGVGGIPATVPVPHDAFNPMVQAPAPATPPHCIDFGQPNGTTSSLWDVPAAWRLGPVAAAGAHADGSTTMWFHKIGSTPDGTLDNIYVDLPAGFVGDPNAVPKCTAEQFAVRPLGCPVASQVGVLTLFMEASLLTGANVPGAKAMIAQPVFNLEPREGNAAELGFGYAAPQFGPQGLGVTTIRIVAKPRTNGDFGVTAFTGQVPAALPVASQAITVWGTPWEAANDLWRPAEGDPGARVPLNGLAPANRVSYDPSWGPVRPFLSHETDCNPAPVVDLAVDAFQDPGSFTEGFPTAGDESWKRYQSPQPAVVDCASLGFEPDIDFQPTTSAADGSSGLRVELDIPQQTLPKDGDGNVLETPNPATATAQQIDDYVEAATEYWKSPEGRATAHLKDTHVTLPPGVSVNPSSATGLAGCPDSVIGVRGFDSANGRFLFNDVDPTDGLGADCPEGSKIGTIRVQTPLLDEDLTGDVVLGQPRSTNPQSGEMLRMFLILRNKERGLVAKIFGSATTDPATGRISSTFLNNPELPFDRLSIEFKAGPKGVLAMPQRCGSPAWATTFVPWSAAHGGGGASVPDGGAFNVSADCGFGFAPNLHAGMSDRRARANGTFSFRFDRPQGQQWLRGLTATLPEGLLASVKDLPLCTDAQAAAAACPLGSQIGLVDAKAGSGDPFVLERKGRVYLTEGYKGGEYGLAVVIRPVAGPFRGAMELSPIVVRQAIHVDRRTAQVTAVSDPFPLIHHGIPLRVREVTVAVDRPRFMLNPSDCSAKQVGAAIRSAQGTVANRASRFQATGCAALPFRPRLALRLVGRRQVTTGKHPSIRALVRQAGVGEAGIQRAQVTLPRSLALDVNNAQALCEFEDGTRADPESHCPRGSIVGRARAVSPLLNRPLAGNVFFVKNIRIDPDTGNEIRTLPMIVVALRGEVNVNLRGESDVRRGLLVNTFADVPDAPISEFRMNIKGGRNGILAVTRTRRSRLNLCRMGRQVAEADMDGQNGKRHDFDVVMRKPCGKRRQSAAQICRKRTDNTRALRACVRRVKQNRAKRAAAQRAAKRKAARREASRRN